MQFLWTSCVVCALIAGAGCDSKKSGDNPAPPVAVAAPADAAAPTPVAVAVTPDAAAAAPAAADPELPLSENVLPSYEATPNTRVVTGDGFRFQIPASFTRIEHGPGTPAYTGTMAGISGPGSLTLWASSEPFTGTLDALVAREVKAATTGGAPAPALDSVVIQVEGKVKQNYARRMTITFPDRVELRTMSVHDKKAYVMHCETPNVANLGSDCITRSTTIHVAPPAAKPASSGPPPPKTPNVFYLGSDFAGTARVKKVVADWVEETLMPLVKPCLAKLPSGTHWYVAFELGKDGAGGKVSITGGPRGKPVAPADPALVTCVAAVVEAAKIDGTAKGAVKLTSELLVHADE